MAFAAERRRIVRRAPKELRSPATYLPLEYNAATLPWLRRATSVTWTKSRSWPPSSYTLGAAPAASWLRKIDATPA